MAIVSSLLIADEVVYLHRDEPDDGAPAKFANAEERKARIQGFGSFPDRKEDCNIFLWNSFCFVVCKVLLDLHHFPALVFPVNVPEVLWDFISCCPNESCVTAKHTSLSLSLSVSLKLSLPNVLIFFFNWFLPILCAIFVAMVSEYEERGCNLGMA